MDASRHAKMAHLSCFKAYTFQKIPGYKVVYQHALPMYDYFLLLIQSGNEGIVNTMTTRPEASAKLSDILHLVPIKLDKPFLGVELLSIVLLIIKQLCWNCEYPRCSFICSVSSHHLFRS